MLDGWSAETDNGAVEGGLRFDGTKVVPIEPHAGTGILRDRRRAPRSVRMLAGPQRPVLTLPVGTLRPQRRRGARSRPRPRAPAACSRGDITLVTGATPLS